MIAVLTCDIIRSRVYGINQRQQLETQISESFQYACKIIPQAQADYMSFSVTQGDEFQFSIESPPYFYHFLFTFRNRLSLCGIEPIPLFRAGIGFGTRTIEGKSNSYQMDGSAYHNSRYAMNSFDETVNKKRLSIVYFNHPFLDKCCNTVLAFCDDLERSHSYDQKKAIAQILTGLTYQQAAQNLGVSKQNIDRLLKRANWNLFTQAMELFCTTIPLENQDVQC